MHGVRYDRRGFTLIELLVVMAIIAVFLGILGMALSGGGGTVATQTGQRTLTTMIAAARSQAVINQAPTRLIIHVDPPTPGDMSDPRREKYLRFMGILVRRGGSWVELNEGTYLPRGIYVVPPYEFDPPPSPTIPPEVIPATNSDWLRERRTILGSETMEYAYADPGTGAPDEHHYIFVQFDARGTTGTYTEIGADRWERRIIVGPATTTGTYPQFEKGGDRNILGGMVRRNGSFTLVNTPDGFPESTPAPPP